MPLLSEEEFIDQIDEAMERLPNGLVVRREPGRILFVGDTHGTVHATKKAITILLNGYAGKAFDYIVFLGDYVDRGFHQLENLQLILKYFKDYPSKVVVLRGNHEEKETNRNYDFKKEVVRYYDENMFERVERFFSRLPLAFVSGSLLAVHGGIPQGDFKISELENIGCVEDIWEKPHIAQILWNDPSPNTSVKGWANSIRGTGTYFFGEKAFSSFMEKNGFTHLVRAHSALQNGFRPFFNGRLLSIYSVPLHDSTFKLLEVDNTLPEIKWELLSFNTETY